MLWNPAILGQSANQETFALTLVPNLGLGLGNNVLSFGALARLIETQELRPQDVERVLDKLPGTGWRFMLDGGTSLALAFPKARSGVFLNAMADTKGLDLPRDLVALVLGGNAGVPNVRLDTLRGATATAVAGLGSSFGFPLGSEGAAGMNLRYLRGLAYAKVREASGSILSVSASGGYSADAHLETEVSTGGNGIAADFGVTGVFGERLRWGAVLGNVGVMNWNQLDVTTYTLSVPPFSLVDASGSVTDFGAVTRDAVEQSHRQEGPREIWLPPYAKVAGAFHPWEPLLLTGEFQLGFGDGYGVSRVPELKLGTELRPVGWLPLRAGIALGGDRGLLVATGLGLDLPGMRLDLAMGAVNGVGSYARGATYTLSNTLAF